MPITCLHQVSEHFCPDGLVFDETSTSYAKCGFPFSIDCTGGVNDHDKFLMQDFEFTGREDLQPAQPSPGCPRQEGYFSYPDEKVREEIISDFQNHYVFRFVTSSTSVPGEFPTPSPVQGDSFLIPF